MSSIPNKKEIEIFLKEKGLFLEPTSTVYAVKMPSNLSYLAIGALSALTIKNYLISFNKKFIVILPLTMMGKLTKEVLEIKQEDVQLVTVKNTLMRIQYKIIIETNQPNSKPIEVRVPRVTVGYPQKDELKEVIEKYVDNRL